jgi:hypothetical protein
MEFEGGFFNDDGTRLDPELIVKPGLCTTCIHDEDESQYVLCTLTRFDNEDDKEFICYSYQKKEITFE